MQLSRQVECVKRWWGRPSTGFICSMTNVRAFLSGARTSMALSRALRSLRDSTHVCRILRPPALAPYQASTRNTMTGAQNPATAGLSMVSGNTILQRCRIPPRAAQVPCETAGSRPRSRTPCRSPPHRARPVGRGFAPLQSPRACRRRSCRFLSARSSSRSSAGTSTRGAG